MGKSSWFVKLFAKVKQLFFMKHLFDPQEVCFLCYFSYKQVLFYLKNIDKKERNKSFKLSNTGNRLRRNTIIQSTSIKRIHLPFAFNNIVKLYE